MTSQMTEMQREVDDKLKTEAALKKAEQTRKEVWFALSQLALCTSCGEHCQNVMILCQALWSIAPAILS